MTSSFEASVFFVCVLIGVSIGVMAAVISVCFIGLSLCCLIVFL